MTSAFMVFSLFELVLSDAYPSQRGETGLTHVRFLKSAILSETSVRAFSQQ